VNFSSPAGVGQYYSVTKPSPKLRCVAVPYRRGAQRFDAVATGYRSRRRRRHRGGRSQCGLPVAQKEALARFSTSV